MVDRSVCNSGIHNSEVLLYLKNNFIIFLASNVSQLAWVKRYWIFIYNLHPKPAAESNFQIFPGKWDSYILKNNKPTIFFFLTLFIFASMYISVYLFKLWTTFSFGSCLATANSGFFAIVFQEGGGLGCQIWILSSPTRVHFWWCFNLLY